MEFLQGSSVFVYLFIFFGKMIEVAASTLRLVLINRGERLKGSLVALLDIFLWITITGTVLVGFTSNPLKVAVFCIAFACGVFFGSWLENKLAIGLSTMHVITENNGEIQTITKLLRKNNIGVTVIDGEGKAGPKKIMLIHIKRSRVSFAVELINSVETNCVITVSDVRTLKGGFIKK